MKKQVLLIAAIALLALSAAAVFAQDGVIKVTLPDGSIVPVFTDGRINGFDIGAPVVVYYKTADGTIANPNFAGSNLPGEFPVDNPINPINGTSITTNATDNNPLNDGDILSGIELYAVDPVTSNGNLVLQASIDDLFNLVNSRQNSIVENGYTLNYSPQSNWFWVSAPADFEGKVYTFAWENTLFPAAQLNAQATGQTTAQPAAQATQEADDDSDATAQPTAQPTVQPTNTPSA